MSVKFRLKSPTAALFPEDGRHIARIVPEGPVVLVHTLEGNKLIEVVWKEQTVLMFARDVRARGVKLDEATPV